MNFSNKINWIPEDYVNSAVIARTVGEDMLARLEWMTIQPKVILDVGCGTGEMSGELQKRYPEAVVFGLDVSQPMLMHAKQFFPKPTYLCATGEILPLRRNTVDLLIANFLLPWHVNVPSLLREWRSILRPNGLLMLSALGPDTMQEWRDQDGYQVLPQLTDMHDIGDLLLQEGWADPVLDVNHLTLAYRDKVCLNKELCSSGMLAEPFLGIKDVPVASDGAWPVTIEVIHAHAWAPPNPTGYQADAEGVVRVPVAGLRRRLS